MYFNPSTYKALGGIQCQQNDEVMNITSITYEYNNSPCYFICPQSTTKSYLDGTNNVCRNENIIRSLCSARHVCDLRELSSPALSCGAGGDKANRMVISFDCIKTGVYVHVFVMNCVVNVVNKNIVGNEKKMFVGLFKLRLQ